MYDLNYKTYCNIFAAKDVPWKDKSTGVKFRIILVLQILYMLFFNQKFDFSIN